MFQKKKGTWSFQGVAPKNRSVASARGSLFGGSPKISNTQTPKGFKKVELYVRVGGTSAKKPSIK